MSGKKQRLGWELTTGLFEVHWKRGPKGIYADRIRICGAEFHYISGKKANVEARLEVKQRKARRKP